MTIRSIIDRLKNAGRKDSAMPDPTTATPATAGLSKDDVQKMIADAINPIAATQSEMSKNLGILADTIKQAPPAPAAKEAGKEKSEPLTLEAIDKLIESKLTSAQQSSQQKAQRDSYIAEKLKDLPAAYRGQLGQDPAKWANEEQVIREQFKADLKTAGVVPKSVGGADRDGGTTPDKKPVDRSKMSAMDLLNSDGKKD